MRKTTSPNRKLGRMIAKNLIILAVVVLAAVVGSMSWFTQTGKQSQANGINITCESPKGYKVAIVKAGEKRPSVDAVFDKNSTMAGKSVWQEGTFHLTREIYPEIFESLYLSDVDSDGYKFVLPKLQQGNGVAFPVTKDESGNPIAWEQATANTHYLSVDIYVRANDGGSIYLAKDSSIRPNSTLTDGVFNKDAVIGAVRMSLVQGTSKSAALVWIPAPNVHYDSDRATIYTNVSQTSNGKTYDHYYYQLGKTNYTPTSDSPTKRSATTYANGDGTYTMGNSYTFCSMTKDNTFSSTEYVGKGRINLWIEGEDDEARLATVGGSFTLNLKLSNTNN